MKPDSPSEKLFAYLLGLWITHGILRAFVLFRVDVYGNPFVGKPSWYIYHAIAIDFLWIVKWTLPLAVAIWVFERLLKLGVARTLFRVTVFLHSLLLLWTVSDHEAYRYLGMHLSISILKTYVNPTSLFEVGNFYTADASVPNLPYALFLLCIPFSLLIYNVLLRTLATRSSLGKMLGLFFLLAIVSFAYLKLWGGGFREKRLKPFIEVMIDDYQRYQPTPMPLSEKKSLAKFFQREWVREGGDSSFIFPYDEYPYVKYSPYQYCQKFPNESMCGEDMDGDGYTKSQDCEDTNPEIYQGALEIPRNGVDEDCNGIDESPTNFLFIILESHRALNCGFLEPYGAPWNGTPALNELAKKSHFWTRFNVNGLPTVGALMATHLSLVNHPRRHISTDFTLLNATGFPKILRGFGYRTHFFSAADPAWDGQTPWLTKWYKQFTYHKDREEDQVMFNHLGQWMKDSLNATQPFLITAISKTNHYPFNPVSGMKKLPESATLLEKMENSMAYTDEAVHSLLDQIKEEEWFSNTLVIIMADHGFPLNEHGSSQIGFGLYTESVWIPFLVYGDHPKLGEPRAREEVASQIDIAPTVLDLAGVDVPNHYMGHSLVSHTHPRHALVVRGEEGLLAFGDLHIHAPLKGADSDRKPEVFDIKVDRLEKKNLYESKKKTFRELEKKMHKLERLNTWLIESNSLGPPDSVLQRMSIQ